MKTKIKKKIKEILHDDYLHTYIFLGVFLIWMTIQLVKPTEYYPLATMGADFCLAWMIKST